jgi:hypothetical protein
MGYKLAAQRLRFDVATRANAEARFNAPLHQTELIFQKRSFCAVLGTQTGYLEFKAHCQIKATFLHEDL